MPQSCCGAVSHWSNPTTARAVPIVHSIAHLRVCTDRGPGEHFDTRSKPRSRSAGASPGECPSTHETGVKCVASSHRTMGTRVAKWQAVIRISDTPTNFASLSAYGNALARHAALSQERGLVPIVESEVLMERQEVGPSGLHG
jgi:fructose-bisphosphate aldolase, class I